VRFSIQYGSMNRSDIKKSFAEPLTWPDARLLEWAAGRIGVPRENPADSFVLHAPLELMARAALLPMLPAAHRDAARERLVWLVATWEGAGAPVRRPLPVSPSSAEEAAAALLKAVDVSDLDEIDRYASWLGDNASPATLRHLLGPALAPSLAAAAHASIALHLIGRTPAIGGFVLRGPAREVGRRPEWRVETNGKAEGDRPLLDALLEAPQLGLPGSDFIFPVVTHGAKAAQRLLADVSSAPDSAAQALSRVAAWSMLQESDTFTPYGWTHALTIPQAVMSLELDPQLAVAVAASQVIGFRVSMGARSLDPARPLPRVRDDAMANLMIEASLHHDAHFVKYTLACLKAASVDPEMADLYVAAAEHLAAWWRRQPGDGFFDDAAY
jgi:hypothetical protein